MGFLGNTRNQVAADTRFGAQETAGRSSCRRGGAIMKVHSTVAGDLTIVSVSGEFTSELVPKFQNAVAEGVQAGRHDFLLDLSQTKALDSAALETLTALQRQTQEQL